jgi:hypothetical protein
MFLLNFGITLHDRCPEKEVCLYLVNTDAPKGASARSEIKVLARNRPRKHIYRSYRFNFYLDRMYKEALSEAYTGFILEGTGSTFRKMKHYASIIVTNLNMFRQIT